MKYHCPLCNGELREQFGNQIHPDDPKYGITLFCPHLNCPAAEVAGHSDTAAKAFEVVKDKVKWK